jgi:hypothetical protein
VHPVKRSYFVNPNRTGACRNRTGTRIGNIDLGKLGEISIEGDLGRVGTTPSPRFMSTAAGKEAAETGHAFLSHTVTP